MFGAYPPRLFCFRPGRSNCVVLHTITGSSAARDLVYDCPGHSFAPAVSSRLARPQSFPETENPNGPQYIYNDLDKKRVVPYLQKHPWLAPLFIRKDGNLILRVQIIVIDTGAHRIVVDTGIGNGKKRLVIEGEGLTS